MEYYVYLLSSNLNPAIYTGVTGDLVRRVYEHRHNMIPDSYTAKFGFTNWYITKVHLMLKLQLKGKSKSKAGTANERTN